MGEKRAAQRHPIELAASQGSFVESGLDFSAKIVNFSVGGFCIFSNEEIQKGEKIQLIVELTNKDTMVVQAKVAWCNLDKDSGRFVIGVSVTNPKGDNFGKLLKFYRQS